MNNNKLHFQDLVQGNYGRKIAYTDVEYIDKSNILTVLGKCIGVFNVNKPIIKYLWDYKNGDQPIRYREKTIRDDIKNVVVENHAWEIVRFKNGQTYGEPIQLVSTTDNEQISKYVEQLNQLLNKSHKRRKDIDSGEWTSAVGTGFKAVLLNHGKNIPFNIAVPTPMNTFIVYQRTTGLPLMAVQELVDENNYHYYLCFTETMQYKVQNGKLIPWEDGSVEKVHVFGGIPIVEYPNNQSRISDVELVIDMLDAINNMQSNRMDAIEQFVQSWVKFINCDIDEETFLKMKTAGALTVKSNNGENKADVDIMTQELNQTESQVAKEDLWNNVLSIEAIPNKQGNTGGDSQGAVELRNGWDFSKQAAVLKDAYIIEAETNLCEIILNAIHVEKGNDYIPISIMDFDVHIVHSPTDNLYVKTESLQMLLNAGINPLIAIKTCGLWSDAEKVFLDSKPFLDVLYKTIDEIDPSGEQQEKAQQLLNNNQGLEQ